MSMSTHVVGFKPPDDKWKKMKAVYDACEAAGISHPEEVNDFFNGYTPDDRGVEVDIRMFSSAVKDYKGTSCQGFEVDIKKLPADVTIIRFYNAY